MTFVKYNGKGNVRDTSPTDSPFFTCRPFCRQPCQWSSVFGSPSANRGVEAIVKT